MYRHLFLCFTPDLMTFLEASKHGNTPSDIVRFMSLSKTVWDPPQAQLFDIQIQTASGGGAGGQPRGVLWPSTYASVILRLLVQHFYVYVLSNFSQKRYDTFEPDTSFTAIFISDLKRDCANVKAGEVVA
ncbi:hypothetical protein EVAR_11342_1 [Eumeta japonica]|uniref:Uncharacterized protein n=1 Tax=Eumeta variegata TaxID=151549 RepID=A0A4C1U0U1_EUMVA|nr:hypothetical protein EVAR_11342_1 [Eumeta japonica]